MGIKDDITVTVGKTTQPTIDVETKTTIKHAQTGMVYADEKDAKADVDNPATSTTEDDIRRDVAVGVNQLPNIIGGTN